MQRLDPHDTTRPAFVPETPGTTIGRYKTYAQAQAAVDRLADDDSFDVAGARIIASDLKVVEYVTGAKGWLTVLAQGALGGAAIGGLIAAIIGAFSIIGSIGAYWSFVLWGLFLGALTGLTWSALGYAFEGGRRDFLSFSSLSAGSYDVVVPDEHAEAATRLLGTMDRPPVTGESDVI